MVIEASSTCPLSCLAARTGSAATATTTTMTPRLARNRRETGLRTVGRYSNRGTRLLALVRPGTTVFGRGVRLTGERLRPRSLPAEEARRDRERHDEPAAQN